MKRLDKTEILFKLISYVVLTLFAVACVYPLIYVLAVSISAEEPVLAGKVVLLPLIVKNGNYRLGVDLEAMKAILNEKMFWISYCNTIFFTFYGTIVSMVIAITGAYALSKARLLWGRGFNFLLTFTMWFNAGIVATTQNFHNLGIKNKWGFIFGLGFNAFNIILLRNGFKGVPSEIEEAATIDGATEFQLLTKIYMPMSKSSIATVTMFYALARWNGYFWASVLLTNVERPLQVYMRQFMDGKEEDTTILPYGETNYRYAMIFCSIVPILILYPQMQKYFAAGVNVGGVKE